MATELYQKGLYPAIRFVADLFLRFIPISLMLIFFVTIIVFLIRLVAKKRWRRIFNLAGWLYAAFYWLWGFNYFVKPFMEDSGIEVVAIDEKQREELLISTLKDVVRISEFCGDFIDEEPDVRMEKIERACRKTADDFTWLTPLSSRPVAMFPASAFLRIGITGMYFPFTLQAQYEPLLANIGMPFTIAHEYFHAAGAAPETEANFLAWLSLVNSTDKELQYSAGMNLLIELLVYYKVNNPEKYRFYRDQFTEKMDRDIKYRNALHQKYANAVSGKSEVVIDRYLKMQSQKGTGDYRRLADWVVAWKKSKSAEIQ